MINQKLVFFKVKEGKLNIWKRWCETISSSRKKEALASLRTENLLQEMYVLFKNGDDHFVIGVNSFLGEVFPADVNMQINIQHRALKEECLEFIGKGEILANIDLRNEDKLNQF